MLAQEPANPKTSTVLLPTNRCKKFIVQFLMIKGKIVLSSILKFRNECFKSKKYWFSNIGVLQLIFSHQVVCSCLGCNSFI